MIMKKFAVLINENQVKLLHDVLNRSSVPGQFPELSDDQCDELELLSDMINIAELQEYDAIGKDGVINDLCDDAFGLEP
jgi:hypothetical protein